MADTIELLSVRLGRKIILRTLDQYPEFGQSAFNETLDQHYGVLPPPSLTLPVGSDMMTVLLIDEKNNRRERQAASLTTKGYTVIHFEDADDAVTYLKNNCCRPGKIIMSNEMKERHGREFAMLAELLKSEMMTSIPSGNLALSDS